MLLKMKIVVVLGEGGHTTELLNLIELLGDQYDYNYIISKEDNLSANKIKYSGPIYKLSRPRGKKSGLISSVLLTIKAGAEAISVLINVHPKAIISAGPAIAVPVSIIGKLFGVKIIFVETGSRVSTLSLTGRIMYRLSDLFFVQWQELKKNLPKAVYAGRLI